MEAPMEATAEAGPAAGGETPRDAGPVEAMECAGMETKPGARRETTNTVKTASAGKIHAPASEVVAEKRAMSDVTSMIEEHPAAVPIGAPMAPSPAKSRKHPDPDTQAEPVTRAIKI